MPHTYNQTLCSASAGHPLRNFDSAPITLMDHHAPGDDDFGPPLWLLIVPTYVSGEDFLPYRYKLMLTNVRI